MIKITLPNGAVKEFQQESVTGRQVAERIRQSRPGMRVLQISGYQQEQLEEQGELLPGAAFLGKPFMPDALLKGVCKYWIHQNGPERRPPRYTKIHHPGALKKQLKSKEESNADWQVPPFPGTWLLRHDHEQNSVLVRCADPTLPAAVKAF